MDPFVDELLDQLALINGLQQRAGDIELVVQLFRNMQGVQVCRYYFVDHPKRLLFWFHEQPTEQLFDGVQGVEKLSHISAPSFSSDQYFNKSRFQSMQSNINTGKLIFVCTHFP